MNYYNPNPKIQTNYWTVTYEASNIHDFIFNRSGAVDCELGCNLLSFSTLSLDLQHDKRQNIQIFKLTAHTT